jgi:hypothetical protein
VINPTVRGRDAILDFPFDGILIIIMLAVVIISHWLTHKSNNFRSDHDLPGFGSRLRGDLDNKRVGSGPKYPGSLILRHDEDVFP